MLKILCLPLLLFLSLSAFSKNFYSGEDSICMMRWFDTTYSFLDVNNDSAKLYALKGINMSEKKSFYFGVAEGYFYLGYIYDCENNKDTSVLFYQKAVEYFRKNNSVKSVAITLNNIGEIYFKTGDIENAYIYYLKALKNFELIDYREGIARVNFSIGNSLRILGNYKSGIKYLFRAVSDSEFILDTLKTAKAFKEIAVIYFYQQEFKRSVEFYKKALNTIRKDSKDYNFLGEIYCGIGVVYEEMKEYEKAENFYNEAVNYYTKSGNNSGLAVVYQNFGEFYLKKKDFDSALKYNILSEDLYKKDNNPYSIGYNLYVRGCIYNEMKDYNRSEFYLQAAFKKANEIRNLNQMKTISKALSELYEKNGDLKNALKYYKDFKIAEDSLFNAETTRKITSIEMEYEYDKKEKLMEFDQAKKEMIYKNRIKKQNSIIRASILFIFLIIVLTFLGFGYYRNKQLAKLGRLEIELNRNIQQSLSQQMNPHFIFNCLNSIKSLILENKVTETEKYFGIFTDLMRKNLEFSQFQAISIQDELTILNLYVDLERLRFKNNFRLDIRIDSEIDQYACKIPPLILQPFVENSILHGLRNKVGEGIITIEVSISDGKLLCAVDDNGTGRLTNKETDLSKGHESLGSSLTSKRIELIHKLYGEAKKLTITDKKDISGNSSGTRIEFGIPVIV